jgi:hypothetical protein
VGPWLGFTYGVLGGLFAELLGLFKLRTLAAPEFLRSPFYWIVTVLMIVAGGILVVIYLASDIPLKPMLIGSFISQNTPEPPGRTD